MEIQLLLSFGIYLVILIGIGLSAAYSQESMQQESSSSFLLGGRSLNYWVTAISAHAADMSDWLLMGFPATLYLNGLPSFWIAIGLVIGMFLTWQLVAPRLRRETEKYDAYTLTSYFERHYNDTSGMLRVTGSLIIIFFFTIYLAAGVKGAGLLLQSSFGIPYHLGGLIAIAVVIAYTLIGGFIAAGWTELFQGIFLLLMLVITPLIALFKIGGINAILLAATQKNIPLKLLPDYSLSTFTGLLLGPVAWGLGYFGMPHVLIKFCGTKDPEQLHKSKYIGMTWQIIAVSAAAAVGLVGIAYFTQPLPLPELIFIEMAKDLFIPFFAGFVLCGILAATLSTMDAQILVLAGIVTQDFYQRTKKNVDEYSLKKVYRLTIVLAALFAYLIAYNEQSTIFGLVQYAWSGLGASFGPLVLLSLYSHYINKYGAIAGMLAGGIISALWRFIDIQLFGQHINEIVPGFFMGFVISYLISFITKNRRT